MLQKGLIALLLLLLAACAGQPSKPVVDLPLLQLKAAQLPGAVVDGAPGVTISYPDERLFGVRAALPMPGGPAVLDPLARLLVEFPAAHWRGMVRCKSGLGEDYDRQLVAKRLELLQRYLSRKGVGPAAVAWQSEIGPGASLELVLKRP